MIFHWKRELCLSLDVTHLRAVHIWPVLGLLMSHHYWLGGVAISTVDVCETTIDCSCDMATFQSCASWSTLEVVRSDALGDDPAVSSASCLIQCSTIAIY